MADLKIDFKDDIFSGSRKFIMSTNEDGTVSFSDATVYEQQGDYFGAGQINAITAAINANTASASANADAIAAKHSTDVNVTLGTGWSSALLTVAVAGVTADSKLSYDVNNASVTQAQFEAFVDAEMVISTQTAGYVTFKCLGTVPTIAIPVTVRIGV